MANHSMLFTGNANRPLAEAISRELNIPLSRADVNRFSDGEVMVDILDHVRGKETYIIQSTSAPTNDHLMEVMIMADALRRASAGRITAVIPYYGYSRQDRRVQGKRTPISSKVVADMLTNIGVGRIITVDLHADQIQGFFQIPVDNVYCSRVLVTDALKKPLDNRMVVSPDVGGVARARAFAKQLNDAELAIIDKRRPRDNESQVMNIIGDVKGRNCIIVDDMVDTAGTLCQAAAALKEQGASSVSAYCVHPVLSGKALKNIESSSLDELVVTDTIMLSDPIKKCPKIRQVSLAPLLAQVLERINQSTSLKPLFGQ